MITDVKKFWVPFYVPLLHMNRAYKLIQLPNGINVVIISDAEENYNSCSLTVAAGSHNDPATVPGLAHLCEHMILAAGSSNHPTPGLFHSLIAKYNGDMNAYTTGEQTSFYFQVPQVANSEGTLAFEELLSVFSSAFKFPLFTSSVLNKEIYAIQSEHENNKTNPGKVLYQATRLLANKNHPFSRFCTGDMNTLKTFPSTENINIRKELISYFNDNFYGENITLCVRGPQSLNHLVKLCMQNFNDIKPLPVLPTAIGNNRDSDTELFEETLKRLNILYDVWAPRYTSLPCFHIGYKNNVILVNSDMEQSFRIVIPLITNDTREDAIFTEVFTNICVELLGNEEVGSFCHFLKEISWVRECYVYRSEFAVGAAGIVLEFKCFDTGFSQIENIVNVLFQTLIPMYLNMPSDDLARFIKEQTIIETIDFMYTWKHLSPMEESSDLSMQLQKDLHNRGIKYLLMKSPSFLHNYEEMSKTEKLHYWPLIVEKFKVFLRRHMILPNAKVIIPTSEPFTKTVRNLFKNAQQMEVTSETDPYYEFNYSVYSVSFPESRVIFPYQFSFPGPNEFIPPKYRNLDTLLEMLFGISERANFSPLRPIVRLKNSRARSAPKLVHQTEDVEIWTANIVDGIFSKVVNADIKSYVTIKIVNQCIRPTPISSLHLGMMVEIMNMFLLPRLYSCTKLGFSFHLQAALDGSMSFDIVVTGIMAGIIKILEKVTDLIEIIVTKPGYILTNAFIRKARVAIRSRYEAATKGSSVKIGTTGLLVDLEPHVWSFEERVDALEESDIEVFFQFINTFFRTHKHTKVFAQSSSTSNIDKIARYVVQRIVTPGIPEGNDALVECVRDDGHTRMLKPGEERHIKLIGRDNDPNNCVFSYLEMAPLEGISLKQYRMIEFTDYLFQLTLVPELRDKRQVGYAVDGGLVILNNVVGVNVVVVSSTSPEHIEQEIESYYAHVRQYLSDNVDQIWRDYSKIINDRDPLMYLLDHDVWYNIERENSDIPEYSRDHVANCQRVFKYKDLIELLVVDTPISGRHPDYTPPFSMQEYLQFLDSSIGTYKHKRHHNGTRSVSVWVYSPMDKRDVFQRQVKYQLESFLKLKGLVIPERDLADIIREVGGKQTTMFKLLYRRFKRQNEAGKFVNSVATETFKSILHIPSKTTAQAKTTSKTTSKSRSAAVTETTATIPAS